MTAAITGLILAGGRASRMGEVDKGLQAFAGSSLIAHVLARLTPQVAQVMINANRNLAAYRQFGCPVWPDVQGDFAGPLAGVQSGLLHCQTPLMMTVPCDSPFLPHDLVARLHGALLAADADLAVAVTDTDGRRQPQPVFCLLKTALLANVTAYLEQGGRKFETWYAGLKTVEVSFADAEAFCNINTFDDLHRYEYKDTKG